MSKRGISTVGRGELTQVVGRGVRFVRPEDVAAVLGTDARSAAKKLAQWAEHGWLRRVRRGLYIPVPVDAEDPRSWTENPLVVASEVWPPCFATGWTAANHWSLTEQTFRTTVVKTGARVRASKQSLLGHEFLISHALPDQFGWGLEALWLENSRTQIADPARTVVDILDDPRLGGGIRLCGDILQEYLATHDPDRLIEYGDRLGNRSVFKRLGYLGEMLGSAPASVLDACRARVSAGISLLDPQGPHDGPRVAEWGVRVNVRVSPADAA